MGRLRSPLRSSDLQRCANEISLCSPCTTHQSAPGSPHQTSIQLDVDLSRMTVEWLMMRDVCRKWLAIDVSGQMAS